MNRRQPTRDIENPAPGYFRTRMVKGGAYVGARIFHRLGMLVAEVNGTTANVADVWATGDQIDVAEFNHLDANRPADPKTPVDFRATTAF